MKTNYIPSAVVFLLIAHSALADTKWIPSQSTSCKTVCEIEDLTAVTSGTFANQQNFYVCGIKSDGDTRTRPGYNLIQEWSPNGELCFAAVGGKSQSGSKFDCLCNVPAISPPFFEAVDVADDIQAVDLKISPLSQGGYALTWTNQINGPTDATGYPKIYYQVSVGAIGYDGKSLFEPIKLTKADGVANDPQIVGLSDGSMMVSWEVNEAGYKLRHIGASGATIDEDIDLPQLPVDLLRNGSGATETVTLAYANHLQTLTIHSKSLGTQIALPKPSQYKGLYGAPDLKAISPLTTGGYRILLKDQERNSDGLGDLFTAAITNEATLQGSFSKVNSEQNFQDTDEALVMHADNSFAIEFGILPFGSGDTIQARMRAYTDSGTVASNSQIIPITSGTSTSSMAAAPDMGNCGALFWLEALTLPSTQPDKFPKGEFTPVHIAHASISEEGSLGKSTVVVPRPGGSGSFNQVLDATVLASGHVALAWSEEHSGSRKVRAKVFNRSDLSCAK